ncbi:hypothetical protein [Candidatus Odyssella thessalonicensis]|uniref:hypothetical protein n=1 Tax=Candidatus Odyssella thessalonicensis TaxID=84647 RepID=UPI000225C1B9|nr:hypothetical protein [Candidatus Odyssella thessalonicensis]
MNFWKLALFFILAQSTTLTHAMETREIEDRSHKIVVCLVSTTDSTYLAKLKKGNAYVLPEIYASSTKPLEQTVREYGQEEFNLSLEHIYPLFHIEARNKSGLCHTYDYYVALAPEMIKRQDLEWKEEEIHQRYQLDYQYEATSTKRAAWTLKIIRFASYGQKDDHIQISSVFGKILATYGDATGYMTCVPEVLNYYFKKRAVKEAHEGIDHSCILF